MEGGWKIEPLSEPGSFLWLGRSLALPMNRAKSPEGAEYYSQGQRPWKKVDKETSPERAKYYHRQGIDFFDGMEKEEK